MIDIILASEEEGNRVRMNFTDGVVKLQSYKERKRPMTTSCLGRVKEDVEGPCSAKEREEFCLCELNV